jgi:RNA recognition motif-containing protein
MSSSRLFVGNLDYSAVKEDLMDIFSPYGSVASVSVAMDRETGKPRGFGFVEYLSASEAKDAIVGADGRELKGRNLRVSEARERDDGMSSPSSLGARRTERG